MKTALKLALAAILLGTVSIAGVSAEAKESKAKVETIVLKDGSKVTVKGDEAFIKGKDGKLAAAPDGTWTTKDGKTITTKDGKIAM